MDGKLKRHLLSHKAQEIAFFGGGHEFDRRFPVMRLRVVARRIPHNIQNRAGVEAQ